MEGHISVEALDEMHHIGRDPKFVENGEQEVMLDGVVCLHKVQEKAPCLNVVISAQLKK